MADKGFGIKQINLIGASGTPTIDSPNNLNLNAINVAISTDVTIGGQLQSNLKIGSGYSVGIGSTIPSAKLDVIGGAKFTGGVDVSGVATFQSNVRLGDNDILNFGDGNDLQIFHDGFDSYIKDFGVGNLVILANGFAINNAANNENIITGIENSAVTLFNDGSNKLQTTGYGVTIFGTLQSQQLNITGIATFGSTSGNAGQLDVVSNTTSTRITPGTIAFNNTGNIQQIGTSGASSYYFSNYYGGSDHELFFIDTYGSTRIAGNLNVSGVSTFTYIQNTGITSTKDLIVSGTGNDVGSISTISLRSRNNYIDFDAAIPNTSPPQQFGIKFQGTTILGGSYSSPDGSIFLNNYNGTTALSINDSGLTLSGITTITGTTLFAKQISVSGVVTATSFVGSNTLKSRAVVSGVTTSIANNGIGNTNITGFKSYSLMKVGLSTAGWLRLYTDSASRTADASRSQGVDPAPGSGVIVEVITTGISTTQIITPFVMGGNLDDPADTTIYAAITNLSGVTTSISVNLTILQLEV
jgi:hypothetical protein